jgi:predicted metal-binding transcription factor (methanogenesis marker protein 9)
LVHGAGVSRARGAGVCAGSVCWCCRFHDVRGGVLWIGDSAPLGAVCKRVRSSWHLLR